MKMLRLPILRASSNGVNIHIKDSLIHRHYTQNTALLLCLPQRDAKSAAITIGVPTGLEPASELFVECE